MRISVFGLGYVGLVSAACLARDGNTIIGVDINKDKVRMINEAKMPIVEPGLDMLLKDAVESGAFVATTDTAEALMKTDLSVICVGTPSTYNGRPYLEQVLSVSQEIDAVLMTKNRQHVIILRSTVEPGTTRRIMELSTCKQVKFAFNPEFLREGSAIKDYDDPPYIIIGTEDEEAEETVREIYKSIDAKVFTVAPEVAELLKYGANAWHAAKITFANEIGRLSKSLGVDGREVMGLLLEDKKLNLSGAYLKPGFAYGGSCLPKDVKALVSFAKEKTVAMPLIESLKQSNDLHIDHALREIEKYEVRNIAVLGLAFKSNTDDLRESPAVLLVKRLIGEGYNVKIYDEYVNKAWLVGANLNFIRNNLPHFEDLLCKTAGESLAGADAVIVTYADSKFRSEINRRGTQQVIDLAGLYSVGEDGVKVDGICW